MRRIFLCGWLVLGMTVLGAEAPGPVDEAKEGFKTAGKAVGEAAVKVGHAVRDGAKATKEGVKKAGKAVGEGARKVGHGVKHGAKEVKKSVKGAVGKPDSEPDS
jgi:hypothetical protein